MKNRSELGIKSLFGLGAGTLAGYLLAQQLWALWQLSRCDVEHTLTQALNRWPKGVTFSQTTVGERYTRIHKVEDGIERISYRPKQRRFQTPLLFQHGMWHGAWCWQLWQELFALWGWETHAYSLPGHANSPTQDLSRAARWIITLTSWKRRSTACRAVQYCWGTAWAARSLSGTSNM